MTKPLSEWVRYSRGTRDIRTFSDLTGMGQGQISQLETGKSKNPTWKTLCAIAEKSEGRCLVPVLMVDPKKP